MTSNNKSFSNHRRVLFKASLCAMILILALALCPALQIFAEEQTDQAQSVQTVEVGIPVEEHPELFLTRSMPTHGEGKIAVFLIEFPDYPNEDPLLTREFYNNIYFNGGIETNLPKDISVAEYFRQQSHGKLNISGYIFDWYMAKHERSYYDFRKNELVMEAAEYYRSQGVDFSQFDGDNNGIIDAIVYHFAGEYSDQLDSAWYMGETSYTPDGEYHGIIDGLKFTTMVQVNNHFDSRTAFTICHELTHTLGMPDLYSEFGSGFHPTDSLMSSVANGTINPYIKILLGWVNSVSVVTDAVDDFKLYTSSIDGIDDIVIVTDEFTGFFDEFFIVAYRQEQGTPRPYGIIWHVDARLNEDGAAFMNQNLRYNPSPTDDYGHGFGYTSPYLFIEELSSDPTLNHILNRPSTISLVAFNENSVLGPDVVPSSDTNDGRFTGIKIDDFKTDSYEYFTFDVSFVADTIPPHIVTEEKDLTFMNTIKLYFNEHVYKGDEFESIQVTDHAGNILDATVALSYYPHHELTVSFNDDNYKTGYKLIFPENSIRDSSGNGIEAITLTSSTKNYLFPTNENMLPGTGEYWRDNSKAYFFPQDDNLIVITALWENHQLYEKLEIMRLDYNGNVLTQTIFDNPLEKSIIQYIYETDDGNYIAFCITQESWYCRALFCFDANGNIKWVNRDFCSEIQGLDCKWIVENETGIICRFITYVPFVQYKWVCINPENGETQLIDIDLKNKDWLSYGIFELPGGRLFRQAGADMIDDKPCNIIQILDAETFEIITEGYLETSYGDLYHEITHVQANDNGTFWVCIEVRSTEMEFYLLDAELNVIKMISWEKKNLLIDTFNFLENDGLCFIELIENKSHSNYKYHIYRYDQYLNLIWESDVVANFIHYFKSPSGDIYGYKSMWEPLRECYIEAYGKEEHLLIDHTHNLQHYEAIQATCSKRGNTEYWYCGDCGVFFEDEGLTSIRDINNIFSPQKEHLNETIPAIVPTCTTGGLTSGVKCSVCEAILVPQFEREIIATNHAYGPWENIQELTCVQSGLSVKTCSLCGAQEKIEHDPDPKYHNRDIIPYVAPTCNSDGSTSGEMCTICGEIFNAPQTLPAVNSHRYGTWIIVTDATCTASGVRSRTCEVCSKEENSTIPDLGGHNFGQWITQEEPTCIRDGAQFRTCAICEEVETQIDPQSEKYHVTDRWVTVREPTCAEDGQNALICTVCEKEIDKNVIPASDKYHKPGDWVVTREPTADEYGEEACICPECGKAQETRRINKLPAKEEIATEKPADNPQKGKPDSGCNSTVGFGSVIVISLIFTCSAFLFKRKED